MFAPQTNPASPAVLYHKQTNICLFYVFQGSLPLPLQLFPVYHLFLAAEYWCRRTLVLGFMSPLSRVGQRPQALYHKFVGDFRGIEPLNRLAIHPHRVDGWGIPRIR